jgi:putative endonuclease
MTMRRKELGERGESLAVEELERRGYEILTRRYRTDFGEIDIIARDADTLVFVEVKARVSGDFGGGAAAVDRRKQRRLTAMAVDYLARAKVVDEPCRFDVVAIDDCDTQPSFVLYVNAFDAVGRR